MLDRIYAYGSQKLFSEIALEAVKRWNIDASQVHHDTTSVSVWGDYAHSSGGPFEINHGNSQDKRPDLIQFVMSQLCVEKDIPIETKIYSGNEDDKTISKGILRRISSSMADYGRDGREFIYIGDCSMVTEANLTFMGGRDKPKVRFISRMPATFNLVNALITEAVSQNRWTDIGQLGEENQEDRASYRSYEKEMSIGTNRYRVAVIHSDFYDRRKQKSLDRKIQKDLIPWCLAPITCNL